MHNLLSIDPKRETEKIVLFIQSLLKKQSIEKVVLGVSGGIDSATCLYLLARSIPSSNLIVVHLPYDTSYMENINIMTAQLGIPKSNVHEISIKSAVGEVAERSVLDTRSDLDKVRIGNIMARTRMISIYDLAKKHSALVSGTENKSEYLLGYFTRFGDEASDFEPIRHLYKTQIFDLARFLGVPKQIIDQSPTAGLWANQTDEGEFGFTYREADNVFVRYFDKKMGVEEIIKAGFPNAEKIIEWCKRNDYKHHVPYVLSAKDSEPSSE